MKVLLLDYEKTGLDFAMRCEDAGHQVRLWQPPNKDGSKSPVGEGIIQKLPSWQKGMEWAELTVMTDNSHYHEELKPYFKKGYPIFGCTPEAAELELDRAEGQLVLEAYGIDTLPYQTFTSLDKAISFAKAENKAYVCKPWGGTADKAMTYVAKSAADLVFTLQRWKDQGLKGDLMLQEKIDGMEMGVGAWFGPGGWNEAIEENWEHKKLMNDDLGPNTGEMGTVMRYVKKSKLFKEMLLPLTERLHQLNYVGSVDVNCIIDDSGKPWPLEFTMRLGWPAFNIQRRLHNGCPVDWMADLLLGKDTLRVRYDEISVGIVMAHSDFPYSKRPEWMNCGFPIYGLTVDNRDSIHFQSVMDGVAPIEVKGKVAMESTYVTAGDYVLVVTGTGDTVRQAQRACYNVAEEISWPSNVMYRTDIGDKLKKQLFQLQKHGYATGMEF